MPAKKTSKKAASSSEKAASPTALSAKRMEARDLPPAGPCELLPPIFLRLFQAHPDIQAGRYYKAPGFRGRLLYCVHANPNIYVIDEFLTSKEVDGLLELNLKMRARRSVVDQGAGKNQIVSSERTSSFTWLPKSGNNMICGIEARAGELLGFNADHVEPLQCVSYAPGQRFTAHHDAAEVVEIHCCTVCGNHIDGDVACRRLSASEPSSSSTRDRAESKQDGEPIPAVYQKFRFATGTAPADPVDVVATWVDHRAPPGTVLTTFCESCAHVRERHKSGEDMSVEEIMAVAAGTPMRRPGPTTRLATIFAYLHFDDSGQSTGKRKRRPASSSDDDDTPATTNAHTCFSFLKCPMTGETLSVKPVPRRAVLWSNVRVAKYAVPSQSVDSDSELIEERVVLDLRTIHQGDPPHRGSHKIGLNVWLVDKDLRNMAR